MIIDDITLYKLLGKGTFGEVFLTSKQGSKKKFATKRINKKYESNPKTKKYIDNEINILKEINHPSIIKLYEIHETSQYYYLVMDYCNGRDLYTCLEEYKKKNNKGFPEEIVQYLMKEIVSGINYLHQDNMNPLQVERFHYLHIRLLNL
jgi:serine/threonine protein kinase